MGKWSDLAAPVAFCAHSLHSLGVVYGDIGTSPLYTMNAIFPNGTTDPNDYIAGCSLVIWTLFFFPCFKYLLIILNTNYHGEGGVFVLGQILLEKSKMHRFLRAIVKFVMICGVSTQVCVPYHN
jgi:KUP system potassium uptake protein